MCRDVAPNESTYSDEVGRSAQPLWVARFHVLLEHGQALVRTAACALVCGIAIACLIPKRYTATALVMPPEQGSGAGALMLAALTGHGGNLGALGSLAGGLLGTHSTTALFMDLLRSGTLTGELIDRFDLQHVYGKRYRVDTAKALRKRTSVADDKKSGVITISVEDTDPRRARDMVQAYLDGLNRLVNRTDTSAARQERIFLSKRLRDVQKDLDHAQRELGEFSSRNSTVDLKEQTRAMVEAGARVQGELLVEQAGLQSLRQIYGDDNVRVRSTAARIASLKQDLLKLAGNGDAEPNLDGGGAASGSELYPPLRQLPRLAVPFANLYRELRVQESAYELLVQQYELSKLEEAKDTPVVSVIDPPSIPEKKSFPPRLILATAFTLGAVLLQCVWLLLCDEWEHLPDEDPRKVLLLRLAAKVRPIALRTVRRSATEDPA